jgi:hypothetical protein
MNPSIAWWTAKTAGKTANGTSRRAGFWASVAALTPASTAAAAKLAGAEKHMDERLDHFTAKGSGRSIAPAPMMAAVDLSGKTGSNPEPP